MLATLDPDSLTAMIAGFRTPVAVLERQGAGVRLLVITDSARDLLGAAVPPGPSPALDPADGGAFRVSEVCGNCKAYNQTEEMLDCIGDDSGDLGYCQIYKFVCAADHTCDDWVEGGPMTSESQQTYRDNL